MWRRIFAGIASLSAILWLHPAALYAQSPPDGTGGPPEARSVALPGTLAFLTFLLLMVIACIPSRKK